MNEKKCVRRKIISSNLVDRSPLHIFLLHRVTQTNKLRLCNYWISSMCWTSIYLDTVDKSLQKFHFSPSRFASPQRRFSESGDICWARSKGNWEKCWHEIDRKSSSRYQHEITKYPFASRFNFYTGATPVEWMIS